MIFIFSSNWYVWNHQTHANYTDDEWFFQNNFNDQLIFSSSSNLYACSHKYTLFITVFVCNTYIEPSNIYNL